MAFDFPATPAPGAIYTPTGGPSYQWDGEKWKAYPVSVSAYAAKMADARNRLVNPAMQISQENAAGSNFTATNTYIADQWVVVHSTAGSPQFALLNNITGYNLIRLTSTAADLTVDPGDYYGVAQFVEASRIQDFRWGLATEAESKPVVLRFRARGNQAEVIAVSVRNYASTRCWSQNVPLTTAFQDFTLPIPPDVLGTWATGTAGALVVAFYGMLGSNYIGTPGWNSAAVLGNPGMTNVLRQAGRPIDITNVGLHLDPNNTGIAPPWQIPNYDDDLRDCKRYWQKFSSIVVDTNVISQSFTYPVGFRIPPVHAGGGAGFAVASVALETVQMYQTTRAYQTITANARM